MDGQEIYAKIQHPTDQVVREIAIRAVETDRGIPGEQKTNKRRMKISVLMNVTEDKINVRSHLAHWRFKSRARLRPTPVIDCQFSKEATSMTDMPQMDKLVALAVKMMLPGKKTPWSASIRRLGKACVNCILAGDHSGGCHTMTFSNLSIQGRGKT